MNVIAIPGIEHGCSQIAVGTSSFAPKYKDTVFAILDAYVERGGNTLDTSRIYGLGKSEQVLAMWLKARRNREKMVIISKCCHHYVDENGNHHPNQKRVRPELITDDLEDSLNRMQTGYFDICLLHRDDPAVPVGELMDVLEEHKRAGLIKAYGVSNWSIKRIEAAIAYCTRNGYAGIAVNSPSLSLARANEPRWVGCVYPDDHYREWHRRTQLPLFSWAAQASGFFSGIYAPGVMTNPEIARVYYSSSNWERARRAAQLAQCKGKSYTANHIALAYVLQQPYPVCAIIGPQNEVQLLDSLLASEIHLSESEMLWLDLQKEELDHRQREFLSIMKGGVDE